MYQLLFLMKRFIYFTFGLICQPDKKYFTTPIKRLVGSGSFFALSIFIIYYYYYYYKITLYIFILIFNNLKNINLL